MRPPDNEHVVLNAVESQLRTEDPQLIACFLAFNSVTRPARHADDYDRPGTSESLSGREDEELRHRHALQLVIVACTLVAVIVGIVMSLLSCRPSA